MKKYNEDEVKSLTKAQISEKLTEEGVLFDPASKKDELIAKLLDIELPEPESEPEKKLLEEGVEESVEPHTDEEVVETSGKDDEPNEESDGADPDYTGEKDDVEDSDDEDSIESDEEPLESDEKEDERFSKIEDLAEGYLAAIDNLPTGKAEQEPEGAVKAVFAARAKERVGTVAVRAAKRF